MARQIPGTIIAGTSSTDDVTGVTIWTPGISGSVAQGSSPTGQSGTLVQGQVVSGNQGYTVGTTQVLNMEPGGRLKVSVSYAANVTPAAKATSNDGAALLAGIYLATRPTWSDGFTGALQVSQLGDLCTTPRGGAGLATNQVALSTTAAQIVPARSGRQKVTISLTTSAAFYVGTTSVSATNGLFVPAGSTITLDTAAAVFAILPTGTATASYAELF